MVIDTFLPRRALRMFTQRTYTPAEVSQGEAELVKALHNGASAAYALCRGKEATHDAHLAAHGLQRTR